jgi:hypothetical protein
VQEFGEEEEQLVRRFRRPRQVVRELRRISGVRDAVQVFAHARVRLGDGRFAQHPQFLPVALGEQHFDQLERLERAAEPPPARACPARER